MNASRRLTVLALAALIISGTGQPALGVEVSRHSGVCDVVASTGRSEAGRDRESGATCARVDNRPRPHFLPPPVKKRERPIDRLRSRGERASEVTGDKGARRPFSESRHPWR